MRRRVPLLMVLAAALTGCTNAPLAGFLDLVRPSRIGRPADSSPLGPDMIGPPVAAPPGAIPPGPIPPPAPPPGANGFMPPLSPGMPSPLPPPEAPGALPRPGPLNLPNA